MGSVVRNRQFLALAFVLILPVSWSCSGSGRDSSWVSESWAAGAPAEGRQGMVSAAHPLATQAGLDVLAAGGNAFDAAVAVAAALNVVEPMMSGMGGYGTILVYSAQEGRTRFLNASGRIPRGLDPESFRAPTPGYLENRRGPKAVSTPGNVNAWAAMAREYGVLPWADVLEPAARLAEEGFQIDRRLAGAIEEAWDDFPEHARAVYGVEGRPLTEGERLVQADLARSLRQVGAEGPQLFHGGALGAVVDRAMQEAGSFLRLSDLAENEAEWWEPIEIDYRGHRVQVPSPPANSFPALVRLGMMSLLDVGEMGHNSVDYLHMYAEVTKRAFWVRLRYAGDPDLAPPPLDTILSVAFWEEALRPIDMYEALPFAPPRPSDPQAEIGSQVRSGAQTAVREPLEAHTTHFVVADGEGNVVSATQTLGNSFGSRIMPEGTGIWMNNSLAYCTFEPAGIRAGCHREGQVGKLVDVKRTVQNT